MMEQPLVTGVDFVSVPTHDIEAACAFYGQTLRLARRSYPRSPCTSRTGGAPAPSSSRPGVSFMGDTFDTGVCRMAFFADPDGNALMVNDR